MDIVVLSPPGREAPVVKRVIGVPGDQVRSTDGRLWLRLWPVQEISTLPTLRPFPAGT
ncbi:S26 family signal peptidase [Actinokineospora sp. NBRC 105648]|uniref:S26 family signal peptidase n=1 Tax=Actinokineospora sp. NBRC 105648 TaxID=3032206 RepID=UPI00332710AF